VVARTPPTRREVAESDALVSDSEDAAAAGTVSGDLGDDEEADLTGEGGDEGYAEEDEEDEEDEEEDGDGDEVWGEGHGGATSEGRPL
jgi:hypothetical protein